MNLIEGVTYYEEANFWKLNPQLPFIKPFNKLYNEDSSIEKNLSSKTMWCVFFMCEPDEEINKFFRIPLLERYEMLKETFYLQFDLEEEYTKECMDAYPLLCLSAVQRALKDEKEMLMKRASFIKEQEYTLDSYEVITGPGGRPVRVTMPGTAKQLDTMHKATKSIMDNFKIIESEFFAEKSKAQLKGNRQESKGEKGEI
jgi:hypothetical protein